MRINLVTPFAEKDAAKALGARWDAGKKIWYVVDVADLAPFMRWIPDLEAATDGAAVGSVPQATRAKSAPAKPVSAAVRSKPFFEVSHCGCEVLPWEDCVHTAPA